MKILLQSPHHLLVVAIDLPLRQRPLAVPVGESIGHALLALGDSLALEDIEELHLFEELRSGFLDDHQHRFMRHARIDQHRDISAAVGKFDDRLKAAGAVTSPLIRRPIQRQFAIFLLPTFLCFCIGFLWPFIQGIYLSFNKFSTISNTSWVGFGNYVKAFQDDGFRHAFGFTAMVAVTSLVLINVLAFAVAFALTKSIRGSNLFRGVFFVPNLIGGIVLGYIWKTLINSVLPVSMSIQANYGFWGLIVVMCWQQIGYMMIIYIAGLQAVPEDMLEAAKIDGASGWKTLWHIILPNVMPSITICTFLSLTNGFKLYDQNLVLTNGAPVRRGVGMTEMLALNIANNFTTANQRGVAQAKAVLFFILVTTIALVQLRLTRSKEVQQ